MEVQVDGLRMEARLSCPTATLPKLAAIDTAQPPEDPPAVRSRSRHVRLLSERRLGLRRRRGPRGLV